MWSLWHVWACQLFCRYMYMLQCTYAIPISSLPPSLPPSFPPSLPAKMGLVGFSNTIAKEGEKYNIICNAVAPVAWSRMNKHLFRAGTLIECMYMYTYALFALLVRSKLISYLISFSPHFFLILLLSPF